MCCSCLGCWVDSFFFFVYRFREWFDWFFFLNFKFVIVVFVLGVGRFGVWVVFVDSVFGLLVFFVFLCLGC